MKKKKVILINDLIHGGGAESVFSTNIKLLMKLKEKFEVYTAYCSDSISEFKVKGHCKLDDSQKGIFKGIKYLFNLTNFVKIFKFLKNIQPDIIHIHNFFGHISPSILLALKFYRKLNQNVKIVQTLHDFSLVCPNSSLFNFNDNELCRECIGNSSKLKIIYKKCYHGSLIFSSLKFMRTFIAINILNHKNVIDKFIVPSNFLKNILKEEGLLEKKIVIIPNPLDEIFIKESLPVKEDVQKENIIIYIGRLSFEKGVNYLLDVWKILTKEFNDWTLYIIGNGPMKYKIESMAQNIANVKFTGWLEKEDLIKILKKSKILVLPSICFENQPMVILEAIFCKTVSLVRNIGGMKELSEEFDSVFSFENNIDLFYKLKYLIKLFENESFKIRNILDKDFLKVYEKHTEEVYLEHLKNIYNS